GRVGVFRPGFSPSTPGEPPMVTLDTTDVADRARALAGRPVTVYTHNPQWGTVVTSGLLGHVHQDVYLTMARPRPGPAPRAGAGDAVHRGGRAPRGRGGSARAPAPARPRADRRPVGRCPDHHRADAYRARRRCGAPDHRRPGGV